MARRPSNALPRNPAPPYSVASSTPNAMVSAQARLSTVSPWCKASTALAHAQGLQLPILFLSRGIQLPLASGRPGVTSDMSLVGFCASTFYHVAYRQTHGGCVSSKPWHRGSALITFAGPGPSAAVTIRPYYVSTLTAITACLSVSSPPPPSLPPAPVPIRGRHLNLALPFIYLLTLASISNRLSP
ncbi:hypothetical protein BS50DRAFT_190273 [Corynespora cassiicola Philippines]|uniref:Uncharacterized protein n=1 Tax=Corynespora cassiicola Philippines TaxID=1448308 RepID=A0A2T2P7F6_CORCC|nr:hypothetical protein BS50DRAFT_190273 [Corynespora cassiicola Philippines]